ncbi:uncharacterized protein METZ01_LOCUS329555, partial [marine metagenome]
MAVKRSKIRGSMPKAKLRKSSNLKPDADLGRLNLRSYVDSKRKQTQKE